MTINEAKTDMDPDQYSKTPKEMNPTKSQEMEISISPDIKPGFVYHVTFEIELKTGQIKTMDSAYSVRNSESRIKQIIKRSKVKPSDVVSVVVKPIRKLSKTVENEQ